MGLFDRLSTLLRSNINDLISRAENPEKMLNQLIVDMKTNLAKAKQQVASAIALEATLSFLGLGVPVTEPSLGLLISNGFRYLLSGQYWISFFPGVALLITIVAINLVADRLRDVLNPRLQTH